MSRPPRVMADARAFLDMLAPGGTFTFQTFDDNDQRKDKALAQIDHGTLDRCQLWLQRMNDRGAGIFVTVNETDLGGRQAENVKRVRALFVDLDGSPLEPVLRAPLMPHLIVESSPERWHAYWLVDGCALQDFKPFQRQLAAMYAGDIKVNDLPRVMRLPGFVHQKGKPFVTRVVQCNEHPRYSVLDLVEAFGLKLEQEKPPPAPPPAIANRSEHDDLVDDLRAALRSFPPSDDDYELWIRIGMALKTIGASGLALWLEWSSTSKHYNVQGALEKWETFHPSQTDHRAVFAEAKRHGWDPARSPSVERKRQVRAHARALREEAPPPGPEDLAGPDQDDAPLPPDAPPPGGSHEELLQRFELIYGSTDVWDCELKQRMAFKAFTSLFGRPAASKWRDDEKRRVKMDFRAGDKPKKEAKKVDHTKVDQMLPRYALIYGTESVFDRQDRMELTLGALRAFMGLKTVRDWGDHPKREVVKQEQVVFSPLLPVDEPGICNLWGGWPIEPSPGSANDQALVERWLKVLHYVCNESDAVTDWVLRWIAYPLKHPGAKMRTSIIMHGPEGSGKNTVWDAVRRIYGRYGRQITQTQLEDKYTDWISANLFIVGNEVLHRQEQLTQKGRLKSLITDGTLRVERKYLAGRDEENFANLAFLSNELQPLSIDTGDRRFLVVWTPPPHPDGLAFYKGLGEDTMPASTVAALYDYLLKRVDLTDFDAHTKPPMTAAKQDLIDASMESHARFVRDWIAGALPVALRPCKTQQLYQAYLYWCREFGERFPKAENKFAALAKKQVPSGLKHYLQGQTRRQAMFYVPGSINPPPKEEQSLEFWLGEQQSLFLQQLNTWRNEGRNDHVSEAS